ncbi:MAG: HAD-IIIC family phosphatase [PVC group bacterium]|nr:HAD-IIIC family phosphatase [PVC group bacterium]
MKKKRSFLEIQEMLSSSDISKCPILEIAVLRNVILEPIEQYLRYEAFKIGFAANVKLGEYDNIFQEAAGGNNILFSKNTDCVLIFMKMETVSWDISRNFAVLKASQISDEIERIKGYVVNILKGIRLQSNAMILWHGFEYLINPSFGICDSQIKNGQNSTIRDLNNFLQTKIQDTPNAYFVDLNICLTRVGAQEFYDFRYWHIAKAPYSKKALQQISSEDFKYIRALKGKNKKCLILDCDNTLWGGVVGEDGFSNIKLGRNYPGSSYFEFQQEVVNLYHRGIIIALCSKNNEEDVWEVFNTHPDMILKAEHIATSQINWQDKASNIRQIALDLNIGLDSIVFMDDSEFEIKLIRNALPDVTTIHLSEKNAVEYREILASCGLFDTITIASEDKNRGVAYRAEANRKKLMNQIICMEDYYKSLEMILEINFANNFNIPRIAQLTQKTNQFNLTTKRYNDVDIKEMSESNNFDVISISLKDKFGNSGIIGVCILRYKSRKASFDTFLLSCRALGRGVENVFVVQALRLAKKRGNQLAIGEYYATRKNKQVENFYEKNSFIENNEENLKADGIFCYDLQEKIKTQPHFFKEIKSEI